MVVKPFFSYIGSKYTRYGAPRYDTVIEPFCGSAAYSVRHSVKRAVLIDKFPKIVEIWKYLIGATPEQILRLPIDFDRVSNLDIPDGAKYLIGFWINKGDAEPKDTRSAWAREYRNSSWCSVWNEAVRDRIASQVNNIKEWDAYCGDFRDAPDIEATWFIDPPYLQQGRRCYNNWQVDYNDLSGFCRDREGQLIVCEGTKAGWMPFLPFANSRGTFGKFKTGKSPEYAYIRDRHSLEAAVNRLTAAIEARL
jgi:hypothetical protein